MDLEDLRFLIDRNSMETVHIQQNRLDIARIIGKTPPRDRGEIPEWWRANKSYISKIVNEKLEEQNNEDENTDEQIDEDDDDSDDESENVELVIDEDNDTEDTEQ